MSRENENPYPKMGTVNKILLKEITGEDLLLNKMNKDFIGRIDNLIKSTALSFKKWCDKNKWFFKTDYNDVVEYYNDHDGYVKSESEVYEIFLTEQR